MCIINGTLAKKIARDRSENYSNRIQFYEECGAIAILIVTKKL